MSQRHECVRCGEMHWTTTPDVMCGVCERQIRETVDAGIKSLDRDLAPYLERQAAFERFYREEWKPQG